MTTGLICELTSEDIILSKNEAQPSVTHGRPSNQLISAVAAIGETRLALRESLQAGFQNCSLERMENHESDILVLRDIKELGMIATMAHCASLGRKGNTRLDLEQQRIEGGARAGSALLQHQQLFLHNPPSRGFMRSSAVAASVRAAARECLDQCFDRAFRRLHLTLGRGPHERQIHVPVQQSAHAVNDATAQLANAATPATGANEGRQIVIDREID